MVIVKKMSYTNLSLIVAELGHDINETTLPNSAQVQEWIDEVEAEIDLETGTSFTTNTVTDEYYDYQGGNRLILKNKPIISISALAYNENGLGESASWISLTEGYANDYLLYKSPALIKLHSLNYSVPYGNQVIKTSYTWGITDTKYTKLVQRIATLMVVERILDMKMAKIRSKSPLDMNIGELSIRHSFASVKTQKEVYWNKLERLIQSLGNIKTYNRYWI